MEAGHHRWRAPRSCFGASYRSDQICQLAGTNQFTQITHPPQVALPVRAVDAGGVPWPRFNTRCSTSVNALASRSIPNWDLRVDQNGTGVKPDV